MVVLESLYSSACYLFAYMSACLYVCLRRIRLPIHITIGCICTLWLLYHTTFYCANLANPTHISCSSFLLISLSLYIYIYAPLSPLPLLSPQNISNLSGGEKTLSSLALVFALHHYKPNPLYVMDEIDAALDFKNVSIVANYIKERTKNAQFIIISLRNNMFELADRLVGIYKTQNATKSVTINPHELGKVVAQKNHAAAAARAGRRGAGGGGETKDSEVDAQPFVDRTNEVQ